MLINIPKNFHKITQLILILKNHEVNTIIIAILEVKKLRQGSTANEP